jgi:hypothetical protein
VGWQADDWRATQDADGALAARHTLVSLLGGSAGQGTFRQPPRSREAAISALQFSPTLWEPSPLARGRRREIPPRGGVLGAIPARAGPPSSSHTFAHRSRGRRGVIVAKQIPYGAIPARAGPPQ